ncbi:MAG TPA: prepilin-type N-terminal cleavage/methylation domain-containing protein, partial [Armatimonadota bacterium]|nr:prepilin-type N-terminal cleavage/methylation domain-containing protein [Armatimonadota bacterium]
MLTLCSINIRILTGKPEGPPYMVEDHEMLRLRKEQGFTLIELLVVIAIIAILAA